MRVRHTATFQANDLNEVSDVIHLIRLPDFVHNFENMQGPELPNRLDIGETLDWFTKSKNPGTTTWNILSYPLDFSLRT